MKAIVDNETFVRAWLACSTYEEVAAACGMKRNTVENRANRLRKAGVRLPAYAGGNAAVDVEALNALIAMGLGALPDEAECQPSEDGDGTDASE